ncbi:MAG TPA: 50S ribosomal protein L11 methyltransferase [Longimicrobium sp.]|nr:50S ribosomal protein L11 methyltransferase [Longimicrobium sp.]
MAETYSIRGHGAMLADRVRMDAYEAALARVVRPGSVVLDIGTGTGMMALIACRLGARKVYAVDPGDSVHLARAVARSAGFADRIEFIQDVSTRVELPERADVAVSDLRGVLPLFEQHVASIADARDRLLAPEGVLVPRRDTMYAAPVEAEEEHRRVTEPWDAHARGFDLAVPRRAALNTWTKTRILPDQLLAEARVWAELDYRTLRDPEVRATLAWTVDRAGAMHGIAAWFVTELAEGIGYTTGPEGPETIYGTAFFPLLHPVPVDAGDAVQVELQARLIGEEYVWVWNTRVEGNGGAKADFRQSTFLSQPARPADLRKRAHDFRPVLGEQGRMDAMLLGMMDGGATLETIAHELRRRFPERFRGWEEALSRAARLSQAYADEG